MRPKSFYSPRGRPDPPTAALGNLETSTLPRAVPVYRKGNSNYLPPCSIDKASLALPEDVIRKYSKLRGEPKAGKLAIKLAKEAFFGIRYLHNAL